MCAWVQGGKPRLRVGAMEAELQRGGGGSRAEAVQGAVESVQETAGKLCLTATGPRGRLLFSVTTVTVRVGDHMHTYYTRKRKGGGDGLGGLWGCPWPF